MMKWVISFVAGGLVIAAVIIFGIPHIRNITDPMPSVEPKPYVDPLEYKDPLAEDEDDFSLLQREALIDFNTVSDPFMTWEGIVFVTSSMVDYNTVYNRLMLYDLSTLETSEIAVDVKYDNILSPMMNDEFIVFIDALSQGGGRICVINRETGYQYTVKEYAYAVPQISMSENMIAFMQQSGSTQDKLYLFDMEARESVTVRTFDDYGVPPSTAYIHEDYFMYTLPYEENAETVSTIILRDLSGEDRQEHNFSRLAVHPQTDGENIIFGVLDENGRYTIFVSNNGANPLMLEQDVLNFKTGDGFVAYTKDQTVFLYLTAESRVVQLNSDTSKGVLASVNGKYVCWYDITGGYEDIDIVKYAVVEW